MPTALVAYVHIENKQAMQTTNITVLDAIVQSRVSQMHIRLSRNLSRESSSSNLFCNVLVN